MKQPLFIKWQHSKDAVGIPLLDEQHRGIVSIINTFFYMMRSGISNQAQYSSISEAMQNYTRIHFMTEEIFLVEAGFEDLEEHIKAHRKISENIRKMEQQSIRDNDPAPFMKFLKKCFAEHIKDEDRRYSACLHKYLRGCALKGQSR